MHFHAVWDSVGRLYDHRPDARVGEAAIHSQQGAAGNSRRAGQLTGLWNSNIIVAVHVPLPRLSLSSEFASTVVRDGTARWIFFCTDGAVRRRQWSWRRFRFVQTAPWVEKLHSDLVGIFHADPEIQLISTDLDSPFADDG